MKTCTLESAIQLIETGLRCNQPLEAGPGLAIAVLAFGAIGAAVLACLLRDYL